MKEQQTEHRPKQEEVKDGVQKREIDMEASPKEIATDILVNIYTHLRDNEDLERFVDGYLVWLGAEDEETAEKDLSAGFWASEVMAGVKLGGADQRKSKIFWTIAALGKQIGDTVYDNPKILEMYDDVPEEPFLTQEDIVKARQKAANIILEEM